MPALPTFKGRCFERDVTAGYREHAYQYATTSRPAAEMSPALVVFVADDDDIVKAIEYARAHKIGVAVRSGGHQYIGSSSAGGDNIQIDLSGRLAAHPALYPYRQHFIDEAERSITLGAGLSVDDVCDLSIAHGIFFPHGECCGVHVGGHSQTGGFSVITPTFGVMIDFVLRFDIILPDGTKRTVRTDSDDPLDKDLRFAVFGGSPGNFGVVTSITVRYLLDSDFPESRCFKAAWVYRKETLQELVQIVNEINDDPERYPDFGLSVMALGSEFDKETKWLHLEPETFDDEMQKRHPELVGSDRFHWLVPGIVVYGVWTNSKGAGQYDDAVKEVFDRFKRVGWMMPSFLVNKLFPSDDLNDASKPMAMSKILQALTFENPREFNLSAKKLAWFGKNTTSMSKPNDQLGGKTFAEWAADKVSEIECITGLFKYRSMRAAIQVGMLGGQGLTRGYKYKDPRGHEHQNEPTTALSHRDCNYWFAFDIFYNPNVKGAYEKTIAFTDALAAEVMNNKIGLWEDGRERRLMLGPMLISTETAVLDYQWKLYFDDQPTYERLLAIKASLDPDHVFTPNLFCVGATTCARFQHQLPPPPPGTEILTAR
ncbi:MAG: FAD-binding oxidoreductase [Ilumatobacteraceae bacterium]